MWIARAPLKYMTRRVGNRWSAGYCQPFLSSFLCSPSVSNSEETGKCRANRCRRKRERESYKPDGQRTSRSAEKAIERKTRLRSKGNWGALSFFIWLFFPSLFTLMILSSSFRDRQQLSNRLVDRSGSILFNTAQYSAYRGGIYVYTSDNKACLQYATASEWKCCVCVTYLATAYGNHLYRRWIFHQKDATMSR